MEISAEVRRDLIEAVRTARVIVDTGWPRDPDIPPEARMLEMYPRANLIQGVAGKLMMRVGEDELHAAEMDAFAEWRRDIREIVQLLTEKQRLLQERVDTQVASVDNLIGLLETVVGRTTLFTSAVTELVEELRAGRPAAES